MYIEMTTPLLVVVNVLSLWHSKQSLFLISAAASTDPPRRAVAKAIATLRRIPMEQFWPQMARKAYHCLPNVKQILRPATGQKGSLLIDKICQYEAKKC